MLAGLVRHVAVEPLIAVAHHPAPAHVLHVVVVAEALGADIEHLGVALRGGGGLAAGAGGVVVRGGGLVAAAGGAAIPAAAAGGEGQHHNSQGQGKKSGASFFHPYISLINFYALFRKFLSA